jgi:hypothetical protein
MTEGVLAAFTTQKELLLAMNRAGIDMAYLWKLTLEPTLLEQIRVAQLADAELSKIR